ncbi:MAG: hypothetical protein HQM08_11600 [Candidatus Riflebacteria bacterium]|nr:hypothetical protein [Candidatus Riflebacteria bacterium]
MKKRGQAIVVVLGFSVGLLLFALAYLNNISNFQPVNPKFMLRAQVELLAEGISNIAVLKYKELPSDFYYAYEKGIFAPVSSRNTDALNTFFEIDSSIASSFLRGTIPDPNFPDQVTRNASFTTYYQMLSKKNYDSDTILITTIVEKDGLRHEIKKTLYAARRRTN